jgi:surface antigen
MFFTKRNKRVWSIGQSPKRKRQLSRASLFVVGAFLLLGIAAPSFRPNKASALTTFNNTYPVDVNNSSTYNLSAGEWWHDDNGDGDQQVTSDPSDNDELMSDRLYYYRNCTDGVAYWVKLYTNTNISGWHNAENWDSAASTAGYNVKSGNSNSIEPGDIAQSNDGTYGHVGFVTEVTKSSGNVTSIKVAELNKANLGEYSLNPYSSKDGTGNFTRGDSSRHWHNFIDVNGANKGLNNEDITLTPPPDADGDGTADSSDVAPGSVGASNNRGYPIDERTFGGDFDGDGYGDTASFFDYGSSHSKLFTFDGSASGLQAPVENWNSGAGNWNAPNTKCVAEDFNGDGKSDIACMFNYGSNTVKIFIFYGSTSGLAAPVEKWYSGSGNWNWSESRLVSGDFDGDGYGDIGGFHEFAGSQTKLFVFEGTSSGLATPYQAWDSGSGNWNMDNVKTTTTDIDGDGKTEIVSFYDFSTNVGAFVMYGSSSGPTSPVAKWYAGTGALDWRNILPFGGNFNGDSKGDFGFLYDYGNQSVALWFFKGDTSSTGFEALSSGSWYSNPNGWTWGSTKLSATDSDGDGKTDLNALFYFSGHNTAMFNFAGATTMINAPVAKWYSGLGNWDWDRSY